LYRENLYAFSQTHTRDINILWEEFRLKVFENRVLRRVFGPNRDEVTGNGENYIIRSLMICTPYPIGC
jgi:hypothetical protein